MNIPETTTIAVEMNDHSQRRIIFLANNDQKCITAGWIEDDPSVGYDITLSNTYLHTCFASTLAEYFESLE